MEICRQDQALEIRELDPFLAELLRQVPESVQPKDSPAAEERLFSAPAAPEEKDLCAEWKVYVVPELRRLFNPPQKQYGRTWNSCNAPASHLPIVLFAFRWPTPTHG